MEAKYLVQAILFDGCTERVVNSCKTDSPLNTAHQFMKMHRNSYNYRYFVMNLETQNTTEISNIFQA